ncbi:MAG: TlpA family protein disulfide reductase [Muribaculaceae bacterium]|nr:TlpA family protein disulfide reductase [Muribaculaceae bacterium]
MRKVLFAAILILVGCNAYAQLPSVQVKDLDGKVVDTSTLQNDGNPFVISFFATWCKPCLRELKAINDYYADWQDETGMKLIAVSIDEGQNVSRVKPLVEGQGFEYEVLLDTNQEFKRAMGIQDIPYLIIVDGDGNVVETRNGYTEGSESHIIDKIRELKR